MKNNELTLLSNNDLQQFNTPDGIELFIDRSTGESFASQRGLARMCNVAHTTIARWATGAGIETKGADIPTSTGVKTGALYSNRQGG